MEKTHACRTSPLPGQRTVYAIAVFTQTKFCGTSLRHTAHEQWYPDICLQDEGRQGCGPGAAETHFHSYPYTLSVPLKVSSVADLQRQPARTKRR